MVCQLIFCNGLAMRRFSRILRRSPGRAARGSGVNLAVREAGEHFCEPCEQKFYIRRPNKREKPGRDRAKANTLAVSARFYAELLRKSKKSARITIHRQKRKEKEKCRKMHKNDLKSPKYLFTISEMCVIMKNTRKYD